MNILTVFLFLISAHVFSEECVFDESSYVDFIKNYSIENKLSKVKGNTLTVFKQKETVIVDGGGCDHLGSSITLKSTMQFTEERFLKKVVELSSEFASWLIDSDTLSASITGKKWKKMNEIYYIKIDEMTVFEASYTDNGNIKINFYIN